jgi:hypothetical protein
MQYSTNKIQYGSNRRINEGNGHLYVSDCVITSACVSEYLGKEIQGYEDFGLEPNKLYGVLRAYKEIEKALETYKGLPLLDKHIAISAERPHEKEWLGTVGTDAKLDGNNLLNTVVIWKQEAIDAINNADKGDKKNGKKCLSVGYGYDIVKEDGIFEGKQYQFKMTNIKGNHVALVDDGRVPDAQIADSAINFNYLKRLSMKKNSLLTTLFNWAMDAKMKDSNELEKEMKELKAKADDEFEGGAEEKKEMLDSMESKLEEMKKKEAKDSEPEKEKEAKDEAESKAEAEKEEKERKEKKAEDRAIIAMDEKKIAEKASQMAMNMIRANTEVTALCERVIGKLPESMLYDSIDSKINKALKIAQPNMSYDNKSLEVKTAILETLANNKHAIRQTDYAKQYAADSINTMDSALEKSTNPLLKMLRR